MASGNDAAVYSCGRSAAACVVVVLSGAMAGRQSEHSRVEGVKGKIRGKSVIFPRSNIAMCPNSTAASHRYPMSL